MFLRSIFSAIVLLLSRGRRIRIVQLVHGHLGLKITLVLVFAPTLSLPRFLLPGDLATVPRGVSGETQYARRLGVRRVESSKRRWNLPRLGEKVVSWSSGSDKEFPFNYVPCRDGQAAYMAMLMNTSLDKLVRQSEMKPGRFLSSTSSLMKPPPIIIKSRDPQRDITRNKSILIVLYQARVVSRRYIIFRGRKF